MRTKLTIACTLTSALLYGCLSSDTGCPSDIASYAGDILIVDRINDIQAFERLQDDSLRALDEATPVALENLELHVELNYAEKVTEQVSDKRSAKRSLLDFFISPANACSPRLGRIDSTIVRMQLISTASLSSELAPGTSLDSNFFAEEVPYETLASGYDDFLDSRTLDQYSVENPTVAGVGYVLSTLESVDGSTLKPQTTDLHQFTYSIELATGEAFEIISSGVLIAAANQL